MEVRDVTEHMTLGDIKKRDIDNVELVQKSSRERSFQSLKAATIFCGQAVKTILLKMGVDQAKFYQGFAEERKRLKAKIAGATSAVSLSEATEFAKRSLVNKIDREMNRHDVKVEKREYTDPKRAVHSGIYIYHHNEIACFLSSPYQRKGGHYATPHIIVPSLGNWFVLTNFTG